MQDIIQMETAQAFTQTFYRQLLQHGQLDVACNQARAGLMTAELPGSSIPVLFSRLQRNRLFQHKHSEPKQKAIDMNLTAAQTDKLLVLLMEIQALQDNDNRNLLLRPYPTHLKGLIRRNSAIYTDLANIIEAVSSWGKLDSGEWAWILLVQQAMNFCKGTSLETKLKAYIEENTNDI